MNKKKKKKGNKLVENVFKKGITKCYGYSHKLFKILRNTSKTFEIRCKFRQRRGDILNGLLKASRLMRFSYFVQQL